MYEESDRVNRHNNGRCNEKLKSSCNRWLQERLKRTLAVAIKLIAGRASGERVATAVKRMLAANERGAMRA
ncbi:MAG: hypothetical protein A3C92_00665 [Candidatus Sungbacteria bacterium RIFCSPHIGHO2_02_FULL_53_17]|uniref:Uncharacterized protein n=1 Tax=Candidatus Sungbacteria bacterium RIFCSPHIGHO2_02_FULL_53_17 TaxID=1802275 RepID=A0A1G2KTG3_9BACT|nr:MAG: hypothetical protein A3C92_00665 [Candidatus Sungbacteria bacterium RIFCSPHIGHO2_02_FULL_53_17]